MKREPLFEIEDELIEKDCGIFGSFDDECSCVDCGVEMESLDIQLCEECQDNYDLDKFWIMHDFEIGKWHEPYDFNENPGIKDIYLKDYKIAEGVKRDDLILFREMLRDKYVGYSDKISNATISQILREESGAVNS